MGNEILKKYSINKIPLFQTGFLSLWNVYQGKKKSTNEEVCIFFLDKKTLKKKFSDSQKRKEIISLLKKSPLLLSKLNNFHYLKIIEPITEDKKILFFITEPFVKTLYSWCIQSSPSKLEIKQIISQIVEGILYLNNEFFFVHSCLNPHFIFLNKDGIIKITNLTFVQCEGYIEKKDYFKKNIFSFVNMLNFISPEVALENKCNFKSDVFSIGCILFMLLKRYMNEKNKFYLGGINQIEDYVKLINDNIINNYLENINFLNEDTIFLKLILNQDYNKRCDLNKLINDKWFNDPKLSALIQLKKLKDNQNSENVKIFLNNFLKCISFFENKVLESKILPYLLDILQSFNNNLEISDLILKIILNICNKSMIQIQFESKIWIYIKYCFNKQNLSDYRIHLLCTRIDYLFQKLSPYEFDNTFIPLISKILDSNDMNLKFFIINNLKNVYTSFQQNNFQSEIYVRLIKILINSEEINLIIELLNCFSFIYKKFSKNLIEESLIKNLANIKINSQTKREICDLLIDLYIKLSEKISIEVIGNDIYPRLIKISMVGNINIKSFSLINEFIVKNFDKIKQFRSKQITDFNNENNDNQSIRNNIIKVTESVISQEIDENVLTNLFSKEFPSIINKNNNNENENIENNNNEKDENKKVNSIKDNNNSDNIKNEDNNIDYENNNNNNNNHHHNHIIEENNVDNDINNSNSINISNEKTKSENSSEPKEIKKNNNIDLEAQKIFRNALKEEQEEIDANILGKSTLRIENEEVNDNDILELNNLENYINKQIAIYNNQKSSNEDEFYETDPPFFDRKRNINNLEKNYTDYISDH